MRIFARFDFNISLLCCKTVLFESPINYLAVVHEIDHVLYKKHGNCPKEAQ